MLFYKHVVNSSGFTYIFEIEFLLIYELWLFYKDSDTFSKMSHVNIQMTGVKFIKAVALPAQSLTHSKMNHVSIKTTMVSSRL